MKTPSAEIYGKRVENGAAALLKQSVVGLEWDEAGQKRTGHAQMSYVWAEWAAQNRTKGQ